MFGRYPAVSIHHEKIHVHRLLMMYWKKRKLETKEHVHHKDGNRLNALKENLEIKDASVHLSYHNKGRKFSEEHKCKIALANEKRKGIKYKKIVNIPENELKSFLENGYSIKSISQFYRCSRSAVRNRIYENKELLEEYKK